MLFVFSTSERYKMEMYWTKQLRAQGKTQEIYPARTEREPYAFTAEQQEASRTRRADQRRKRPIKSK